jgi:uncharacterized protein
MTFLNDLVKLSKSTGISKLFSNRQEKIMRSIPITVYPGRYGVCRLNASEANPSWATDGEFCSITRTRDELSIICLENNIPANIKHEGDWRVLKMEGPLDFSEIGILAGMITPLAQNGISILAVGTFDTDYILVKNVNLAAAIQVLEEADFQIRYSSEG